MRPPVLAVLVTLLAAVNARAEEPCQPVLRVALDGLGTPLADFMRVGELAGVVAPRPRLIQRGGARTEAICEQEIPFAPRRARGEKEESPGGAELRLVPVRLTSTWSSRYPSGENDGLLWSGRGVSQLLSAGAALRYGAFSAAVAPEVTWSENRAFDIVPNGRPGELRYGNPYYGDDAIDLPQRFGTGPFATWGPGQSFLRVDRWNAALGISTENLWLGPGIRNSIIMSSAGPGFPHVFVGTSRPGDIWIGKAEALLFWGQLRRTRFIAGGGKPLISGLAVGYEPRWIPGLHVGLGRVMIQPWDGLRFRDYLAVFQSFEKKGLQSWYGESGNNARDNQLASLFGRWVFPEVGLEIYGEWAREDHNWSWESTLREPDHSQAFLLGLQKVFRVGARLVRLHVELADLQELRPLGSSAGNPVYYVHGNDLGYTNRGQLLGAWIGPGADSQTLAVDVFHRGGRIGGYLERVRRNEAYYWAVVEPAVGDFSHDTEVALGVRQALEVGPLEVTWEAAAAYRWKRDFIRDEPNVKVVVGIALPMGR